MPIGRNDEVSIHATVGEFNQLMMLAEEGFRAILGKIARQLNEQAQAQPESEPRPRSVAAE